MITRFAVTGGRDFANESMVAAALDAMPEGAVLVHGAAKGADTLSAAYWESLGRKTESHPAKWARHGRGAGLIRNHEMVRSGIETLVSFPGGRGTAHMTDLCKKAGVPVIYAAELNKS